MIDVNDIEWLKINYPGVYYIASQNMFQGCLWFRMSYSVSVGKGLINPDSKTNFEDGFIIEDAYEITIGFDDACSEVKVREVGGRIMHTKNKWRLSLADVHMYKDGSLCLCPEPEEKMLFLTGFKLKEFFNNFLIPYFYYQSYLERFGKEPWKSSGHGDLGILESYNKQKTPNVSLRIFSNVYIESLSSEIADVIVLKKGFNQSMLCVCSSGQEFRICHSQGYDGFKKLYADFWTTKSEEARK